MHFLAVFLQRTLLNFIGSRSPTKIKSSSLQLAIFSLDWKGKHGLSEVQMQPTLQVPRLQNLRISKNSTSALNFPLEINGVRGQKARKKMQQLKGCSAKQIFIQAHSARETNSGVQVLPIWKLLNGCVLGIRPRNMHQDF